MIPADDLKPGLYVTVVEWTRQVDYSYCGDALLIKAVNLPYLVVDKVGRDGMISLPGIHLDIRAVDLMVLKPEYVDALKAYQPPVTIGARSCLKNT